MLLIQKSNSLARVGAATGICYVTHEWYATRWNLDMAGPPDMAGHPMSYRIVGVFNIGAADRSELRSDCGTA